MQAPATPKGLSAHAFSHRYHPRHRLPYDSSGERPNRAARRAANRGRPLTPAIDLPNHALDVFEVAEVLDVCDATVRREAKRGRLHGTKVGSRWRFQPAAVAAYLDGRTRRRPPNSTSGIPTSARRSPPPRR